jgi:hypothetical protein
MTEPLAKGFFAKLGADFPDAQIDRSEHVAYPPTGHRLGGGLLERYVKGEVEFHVHFLNTLSEGSIAGLELDAPQQCAVFNRLLQ